MTTTYNYILDTGTVTADTSDLLTNVQGEYVAALGSNLDTDASTPQGALITAETLTRSTVMRNNAEMANLINPNYSYGTFLDGLLALTGIDRGVNKSTIANGVQVTGDATGLVNISAGQRLQTVAGDIFVVSADANIPNTGVGTITINSQSAGDVPLPLGDLQIMDGVIGWGSATVVSSTSINLGTLALSDGQAKNARIDRLAALGTGSSAAIKAAVLGVKNITSCNVVENNTGATGAVQGVTFTKPNAMWVCVDGAPNLTDLAQALYSSHNGGCPWDFGAAGMGTPINSPNGIPAVDPATGYTYNVLASMPVYYDAYVKITVKQTSSVAAPQNAVQNAIMNYAGGLEDGETGLVIGASVSAFEMAGAVVRQLPGMYVKACSVACVTHGSAAPVVGAYTSEFVIAPYQRALLAIGNIQVTLST